MGAIGRLVYSNLVTEPPDSVIPRRTSTDAGLTTALVAAVLCVAAVIATTSEVALAASPALTPTTLTSPALTAVTVTTYAYGSDDDQTLDAYIDTGRTGAPWVVTLHGGSWAAGSKANTASIARKFAAEGFQVFNVDYRPSTDYGSDLGAAWPAQRTDVLRAIGYVKDRAGTFRIDPARGAVYGFSAGGHVAASVGLYDGTGAQSVRAVVTASGVLQPQRVQDVADSNPATGWAGDRPTQLNKNLAKWAAVLFRCPHLPSWADCNARWNTGMPERDAGAGDPAVWMIMGSTDQAVPPKTLSAFGYWLRRGGVRYVATMVPGGGHDETLLTRNTTRWRNMITWLRARTA
jgi:acetyl esterase/lipase